MLTQWFSKMGKFPFAGLFSALIFCLLSGSVRAQGDLMIFPKRVVFEGAVRSEDLNLANIGRDTARYTVSFLQYRMTVDGKFEEITVPDSGQMFADPFLRFFPRSVILAPNEAQTVKVQLTRTTQLQPGEYRSHIYFRSVPNPTPLGSSGETAPPDTTGISIRLVPIYGLTIPVIIRSGTLDAQLSLSADSVRVLPDTTAVLFMEFHRTGTMSMYGNLTIDHISPQGKTTRVGYVQGLGVYTPNRLRRFQTLMEKADGVDYRSGRLHIEFVEEVNFREVKRAETDFQIP